MLASLLSVVTGLAVILEKPWQLLYCFQQKVAVQIERNEGGKRHLNGWKSFTIKLPIWF